jgi:hypothetical protein
MAPNIAAYSRLSEIFQVMTKDMIDGTVIMTAIIVPLNAIS